MKTACFICAMLLLPALVAAQEKPSADSYPVNFDRNTQRTRTDRQLNSLTMGGNTVQVDDPQRMYHDLTAQRFVVRPGQTVTPTFGYTGNWMQGYVYLDLDANGSFDVQQPGPHGELQDGNELVSFAGMNLADGKYNSAGESLQNLSAVQPPQFTIPADLAPGYYMMRWKVDWDNCDPAGRVDAANSIIDNGGVIADVLLLVTTEPVEDAYQLLFADEFDQPDGSSPDPDKWRVSTRYRSTWNRWISASPDVAFIEGGHLVCRAIPNPDTSADDVPMLTGAVETRGHFAFTYGKVEVRLRTEPYAGNFPAAWMMPQPPCDAWPAAGEIDIFEAIDAKNTSFHTIHSHWTYDLGHKSDPQSSFSKSVTVGQWHTYGLEWTAQQLTFTVDGVPVGTYQRSTDEAVLSQGQWPFTHPFYLILNQSVGDGSWAKAADTTHTYETRFDYVRVYQQTVSDAIRDIPASPNPSSSALYDLAGRRIADSALNPTQGEHKNLRPSSLRPGIYILGGRKIVIR